MIVCFAAIPGFAQTLELVSNADPAGASTTANGSSVLNYNFSMQAFSADNRYLVFESDATDLIPGFVNNSSGRDIFLLDRDTGFVELVSHIPGDPLATGNNRSIVPMISADGRWIAYQSASSDLVSGQVDNNGGNGGDIFLYDRVADTTFLVSHTPGAPANTGNDGCGGGPSMSADGGHVSFACRATDFVTGQIDTNGLFDVFVYDVMQYFTQ